MICGCRSPLCSMTVRRRLPGFTLGADRLAFDALVEAHLAANFGQDGHRVRVPLAEDVADFHLFVLGDHQRGPVGNGVLFELAFLRVHDDDFAVAGENDVLALLVDDAADAGVPTRPARRVRISLSSTSREAAPPMWNVRIVSCVPGSPMLWAAMMPTAIPSSTSLHRWNIHAVAQPAHAQRRFARHGAADLNLFQTQVFDFRATSIVTSSSSRTITSSVIGLTMLVRLTRPRMASARLTSTFSPRYTTPRVIPLRRAAVVRRDDHVLADVGQLAGQVTAVGRLEGRVGQSLAGAVGGTEILQHGKPFAEVGLDRRLDDFAAGLGHQSPHAGELADLFHAAAGTGIGHQEHRVDVVAVVADVVLELVSSSTR